MEVHFPTALEETLMRSAAKQGRNPGDLVQDAVAHYFGEQTRSADALNHGEDASQFSKKANIVLELPVWHLGDTGSLSRRDIYDDVR